MAMLPGKKEGRSRLAPTAGFNTQLLANAKRQV